MFAEGKDIVGDRPSLVFTGGEGIKLGKAILSPLLLVEKFLVKVRCCDFLGNKWRRRCGGLLGSWRLRSPRAEHGYHQLAKVRC